jgi:hypothetical protein
VAFDYEFVTALRVTIDDDRAPVDIRPGASRSSHHR